MHTRNFPWFLFLAVALLISCQSKGRDAQLPANSRISAAQITFIELGSTTCIPCKKMQPVMKSIESRYAGQISVLFHDVMKDRSQSQKYKIKLIPTQVFLDKAGKEIMRHEGFFAEAEIDKFLQSQGLTPRP
jgi:thioredoxin 1